MVLGIDGVEACHLIDNSTIPAPMLRSVVRSSHRHTGAVGGLDGRIVVASAAAAQVRLLERCWDNLRFADLSHLLSFFALTVAGIFLLFVLILEHKVLSWLEHADVGALAARLVDAVVSRAL